MPPLPPSDPSAGGVIVVGFDGSAGSERAVERAAALAGDGTENLVRHAPCDVLVVR